MCNVIDIIILYLYLEKATGSALIAAAERDYSEIVEYLISKVNFFIKDLCKLNS